MKHLVLVLVLLLSVGASQAATLSVDLDKIDPKVASEIIAEQQRIAAVAAQDAAKNAPSVTMSQAVEWSNIGTNLATAVSATAKALSISVNEFAMTPVGWWTFAFLFWYILGNTLWHIVGGVLVWAVLGLVIWHSFKIFHIPQRRIISEHNGVNDYKYYQYEFKSWELQLTSVCFHAGFFIVISIIMLCIIF